MTAERALITSLLFIPITRKGGIEIGVGIVITSIARCAPAIASQ